MNEICPVRATNLKMDTHSYAAMTVEKVPIQMPVMFWSV